MNIMKSTIRIAGVALAKLAAGIVQAADAAKEWQKGPSDAWFVKWNEAAAEAKKTGKPIFVLKTGSDWCGWCIRLRKNVLSKPEFEAFAKKNLVLLYLDSPSKTPLCAEQKKHNQEVSRKLSLGGGVPNASVVTADGKKLGSISGGGLGLEDYLKKLEGILKSSPAGNGNETALSPRQSAGKMPSQFMPTRGLLASFNYDDGKETNMGYGEVRRENDHVAFVEGAADYDGVYKYSPRGCRSGRGGRFEEDYVVPELNFDHFTVACSFRSAHTNDWGQYFFRVGQTCYSILEVSLSRGSVSVYGRKLRGLSVPYVDKEWNWLVLSMDVPNRAVWISVNGCEPASTSLPEDFFWFIPSDRILGDAFRRLTFGDWQCGKRYRGQVDDLMVYDRALDREEFANVCKRTAKAKDRAVASFEKTAPVKLPELRDDRWLFIPNNEQSVYWNGAIRTRDVSLKVRRETDGLCVEPPGDIVDSVLDLTLPVVDASGRPLSIVGIGSECDPYCIRARKSSLSVVHLPDTLKTVRQNAFAGCLKLESIVIPENVREIGSCAFVDCGHLTKLEIRSKSVTVDKGAFSGSTPVGTDMPQEKWTTGPVTKEIKGDPEFEYAKEGRMSEPLFSFSYGDIRFGAKHGDVSGWGSTKMKGHADWGMFDLRFIKLGEDQLAGVTLKWRKKESTEGSLDAAKTMAKELVALIEEKVKGRVFAPLCQQESEWPEYGDRGNRYADYGKLKSIGSSKTEVNGYTIKVDIYGGTKDANVAVVITIIDNYMFKAWGMSPKI